MARFSRLCALWVVCAVTAYAAAVERRPIQFEDLFGMKRLSDLKASPDGRWAAFVQTEYSIEQNRSDSDIWLVSLETGQVKALARSSSTDRHPRWSADGRSVWFLSTRGGDSQVWEIPVDGGEARQVTKIYGGVDGFVLAPSGKFLLYSAEVWPDCPTEEANRKRDAEKAADKSTGRVLDRLFFRQWNRWVNDKYSHVFLYDIKTGAARELVSGKVHCPPLDLGSPHDFVLSPDEKEVAFVYNPDPQPATTTNNDVFRMTLEDGKTERLTKDNLANDNGPLYSPDGLWLAYLAMGRPGYEADKQDVVLVDRKTGERRNLTQAWGGSVSDYEWSPDGKRLFFTSDEAGRVAIFSVKAEGGPVEKVVGEHHNSGVQALPGGGLIFFQQAANRPDDVFRFDPKSMSCAQITRVNAPLLEQLDMGAVEDFWFAGAKGEKVHGLYLTPPKFNRDKKYPVVFLIHGGPQGAFGDEFHYRWNAQMFSSPGYVAVMINFHGSKGYGQAFTDAVSRDWGGAPYEDMVKGVEYFTRTFPFADKDRMAAAGASYGGFMVNWIAGHDNPFRCLVSHDGVFDQRSMYGATEEVWFPEWEFGGKPWEPGSLFEKWSPINLVSKFKTPMLVVHSELDYRVPVNQGFELFTALQSMGVESKLLYFPDEDHFVKKPQNARLWWKTVMEWIAAHVK